MVGYFRVHRLILGLLAAAMITPAAASELWISGKTHPIVGQRNLADGGDMFKPDAPWRFVAAHTTVLELGPGDVLQAPDAQLKTVFADLRRRNIAFALQTSLLGRTATCHAKNEAYWDDLAKLPRLFDKVHRNGGEIRYVAMDGPFHFGHRWSGPTACHETAEALAGRIKANIAILHRYFPAASVGDIEGVDTQRAWIAALADWADTFERVTGERLAFLQTDISWSQLAMQNLVPLHNEMRQRHIPLGIIIDSDAAVTSDTEWTNSALSHIAEIEGPIGVHPEQEKVETWTDNPTHALPEIRDGTLTNVAYRVLQPAPVLTLAQGGGVFSGRLADHLGRPIANARIEVETQATGPGQMAPRRLAGVVPAGAQRVTLGVRAGNEGSCICNGPAVVLIGTIAFQSEGDRPFTVDPGKLRVLALRPGETNGANIQDFPVTPGRRFVLEAPMNVPLAATHAGYVTAIFLNAARKGIGRVQLWFEAGGDVRTVNTDGAGRFTVGGIGIRAYYAGTTSTRPVMAVAHNGAGQQGRERYHR